jgi:hypothetical protein
MVRDFTCVNGIFGIVEFWSFVLAMRLVFVKRQADSSVDQLTEMAAFWLPHRIQFRSSSPPFSTLFLIVDPSMIQNMLERHGSLSDRSKRSAKQRIGVSYQFVSNS